jgi:hypothetical protein
MSLFGRNSYLGSGCFSTPGLKDSFYEQSPNTTTNEQKNIVIALMTPGGAGHE